MIAGAHRRDARADSLDDAGPFVTSEHREPFGEPEHLERLRRRHHVAREHVLVGMAEAGERRAHEHLAGLGVAELELLDTPVLAHVVDDSAFDAHFGPLFALFRGRSNPSPLHRAGPRGR